MASLPLTRAEISHSRLASNFARLHCIAEQGRNCDLIAVVKANAYGHGISCCIPTLVAAGAKWLSVTSAKEGAAARALAPGTNILVLTSPGQHEAEVLVDAGLTATVCDVRHLAMLAAAAKRRDMAPDSIPVHLEIDTGMSRQGMSWECGELPAILDALRAEAVLRLDGIFTHFASPEILDSIQNIDQTDRFIQTVRRIAAAGFCPRWLHAGNSSTLIAQRTMNQLAALAEEVGATLLLRPGLALYGYVLPFVGGDPVPPVSLQPVLKWTTAILSTRTVTAGAKVGYDGTFIACSTMKLGLLPVGYADGLNRKLSNRGHVLIRGKEAPIIGRISMDLTTVDLTGIPDAEVGDEVLLIGEENGRRITADDHAHWAETISYEILCAIGARVPRVDCE